MIFGMDFSSLEETEKQGAVFRVDGKQVELVEELARCGVTSARLRLWNDPYGKNGEPYMGGTCDIERVERLAQRAKDAGMSLLLDFHYSDFWCDPARQMIPKAWQGKTLDELCPCVYEFTARTLDRLDRKGLSPACVQVGNEITNGMLWPVGRLSETSPRQGFDELAALLRAGCAAVRENSDAKVMLHLENSGNNALWTEWLDAITERQVLFDILGASYYPYWHGDMEGLRANLCACIGRYGKDISIVETAYPFTTRHYSPNSSTAALCIADGAHRFDGSPVTHELSREGQAAFISDLISLVEALPEGRGKSIYWWEPGWIPVPGSSWASTASLAYCGETAKSCGNEWANQCLFDYQGNATPALEVIRNFNHAKA